MSKTCVIFDWDGTLIDSTAKIIHCMQQAANDVGLPPVADQAIRTLIGLSLEETTFRLYPDADRSLRIKLQQAYSHFFVLTDQTSCCFFDGVESTLHALLNKGIDVAVATGKSRKGLDRVLVNLGWSRFFSATRCADETASKPNPLMLHELLDELMCVPEQAIMVGDTTFDMHMAQAAGMDGVAVSYGAHSAKELLACLPLALIDRLDDLLPLVLAQ